MLLTLMGHSMMAKPVEPEKAVQVAKNFMAQYVKGADKMEATVSYTHPMSKSGQPAMYVVNLGSAFVIVSADDVAHPVLGYSTGRAWPTKQALPSQVTAYLDDLAAQIEAATTKFSTPNSQFSIEETSAEWQQLLSINSNLLTTPNLPDSVGPLLTTTWGQGQYYNALCPEDAAGPDGHVYTGCVATAMAQIINYWGYPIHGRGIHSYQSNYGTLTVNYDSATYDYVHMPSVLTATSTLLEKQAVATLMRDCGVAANMTYGPNESGSYDIDARAGLINFFRLSPDLSYAEKSFFADSVWENMLRTDISANRPVMYSGQGDAGGHSFVCDGYKQNGYFHFNFGWSGYADGWYLTSAINPAGMAFNSDQSALFRIVPDSAGNVILGQMAGASTFTVDNPLEFYHLLGHNAFTGTNYTNTCSNNVDFVSANDTVHLVVDIIHFDGQNLHIYAGNEVRHLNANNTNDLSPIVSSYSTVGVDYSGTLSYSGFKLCISQDNGCRLISNVGVTVDTTAVALSWSENGSATGWQIEYGTEGYPLGEGTTLMSSDSSITVSGLVELEKYDFYIRPQCGGAWFGPVKIMTKAHYWIDIVETQPDGYVASTEMDQYGRYPITISSAEGLAWWAKQVRDSIVDFRTTVNLAADIDLGGYLWKPVYEYYGTFNGNGHTISNMTIVEEGENSENSGWGFFRMYRGYNERERQTVCNLFFKDPYIEVREGAVPLPDSNGYITYFYAGTGVLSGRLFCASVLNCGIINGTISQHYSLSILSDGMLVGLMESSDVNNCFAGGSIRSVSTTVGGLIGTSSGNKNEIHNSYSSSNVSCFAYNQGSVCGYFGGGILNNCYGSSDSIPIIGGNGNPTESNITYAVQFNRETLTLNDSVFFDGIGYVDLLTVLNKRVEFENDSNWGIWHADSLGINNGAPLLGEPYQVTCSNVENVVAVNVANDSGYAVRVSWDDDSSSSNWTVKCQELDSLDRTATFYLTDTNVFEIEGLTIGRKYNISIRRYCDSTHHSGWGRPVQIMFDKPYWTDIVTSQPEGYVEEENGNVNISSAEGLAWLACMVNGLHGQEPKTFRNKTVSLIDDIDLAQYKWMPIGSNSEWFLGCFNGNNHTISNMYIRENRDAVGLFGVIYQHEYSIPSTSRKFSNIILSNCTISGLSYSGGLVGEYYCADEIAPMVLFDNCHVRNVAIHGNICVGAIAGYVANAGTRTMINCSSTGEVHGMEDVGGLFGSIGHGTNDIIANCYSTCDIYAPNGFSYSGGLVGWVKNCSLNNCYAAGSVANAGWPVGTVVGYLCGDISCSNLYGLQDSIHTPISGAQNDPNTIFIGDTVSFSSASILNDTIVIINSTYTSLLDVLNAWVDANDSLGIFRHWDADSINENRGFPVFSNSRCYTVTLNVNDQTPHGTVTGTGTYCELENIVKIHATPQEGYHFTQWNDGNTNNPRVVRLTQDTSFTASFEIDMYSIVGGENVEINYSFDFETPNEDNRWTILNNYFQNGWYINTLDDTSRALFVSNRDGENNEYYDNPFTKIYAYTTISLLSGQYAYGYDWRCNGELYDDYLRVFLIPGTEDPNTWPLYSSDRIPQDVGAIFLDGGQQLIGHTEWTHQTGSFNVPADGDYKIVFYWENGWSWKYNPAAAVDNIAISNIIHDADSHGVVIGSDTVPYLDTVVLTAIPNPGYIFLGWSDGNTDNPRTVIATKDQRFRALFLECTPANGSDTIIVCDSYTWHGTVYTTDAVLIDTLITTVGCDSIVTLYLNVNHSSTSDITATACDNYTWHGIVYTADALLTDTISTMDGCDSIVTLYLTINYSTTGDTTATACDSFVWWNMNYTNSTDSATHIYTNAAGCDSTVTLHLTINHSAETTVTDTAEGSYTWNGTTYTESGTYTWNGTTAEGCDSTVTLLLTITPTQAITQSSIQAIKIYPNPTSDLLTIDADDILSVELFDLNGRRIFSSEVDSSPFTVHLSPFTLSAGSYLLRIHTRQGTAVQHVILK